MKNSFKDCAANEQNPKWNNLIKRETELYSRNNDIRTEFERDYTRVIHSTAYRRLKHKTQVFFSPDNDHICTRIEHVIHVESIAYTIAKYLGLNVELTRSIATAHDIGHSPFGHQGERVLSELSIRDIKTPFWHEKNGLEMVDKIELLEDPKGNRQNMNLTYGVRDGIVSHCGEIDENQLKPRDEFIDLNNYKYPNQYPPYTWEGCVVKIADKISYLGRDIADAVALGLLDGHLKELRKLLNCKEGDVINNTVLINDLIFDLCKNSSPEKGLCFSKEMFKKINDIKRFNYNNIYHSEKLRPSNDYFRIVITGIYEALKSCYNDFERLEALSPVLAKDFQDWLKNYWNLERDEKSQNAVIFDMKNEIDYYRAIIYYISGMTDNYAIAMYNQVIGF